MASLLSLSIFVTALVGLKEVIVIVFTLQIDGT